MADGRRGLPAAVRSPRDRRPGSARPDTAAAGPAALPGLRRGEPGAVPAAAGCAARTWSRRRPSARAARRSRSSSPTPSRRPSTASRPSAEALRDVMSRYFEAMRVALERHGGTVEKFIGDAVMAVFGLPVRHEDDALRAVRGAAAMQAALPRAQRRLPSALGSRAAQPHRRQQRRGDRRATPASASGWSPVTRSTRRPASSRRPGRRRSSSAS